MEKLPNRSLERRFPNYVPILVAASIKKEGQFVEDHVKEKAEEDFADRHVDGTFTPIHQFAKERRMQTFETDDQLVDAIQEKFPDYTVGYDASGERGVNIFDHAGHAYRFKEGVREGVVVRSRQNADTREDAEEAFVVVVQKRQLQIGATNQDGGRGGKCKPRRQQGRRGPGILQAARRVSFASHTCFR